MAVLRLDNITKSFGTQKVLSNVSFVLEQGSFGCILGSSGSGKSTLLRIIAGLETPDAGTVELNGKTVAGAGVFIRPEKRNIGMIFQDYALFPHLTVDKNIRFGIGSNVSETDVNEIVKALGLDALLSRYPHQLSGGQQQRVAIARSMVMRPSVLLMDEPFSNLDEWMKEEVRDELSVILRKLGATVLFVTHHAMDALSFADCIVVMHEAQIIQQGSAADIINNPRNSKVAGIFGKVNEFSWTELKELFGLPLSEGNYFIKPEHFVVTASGKAFTVTNCVNHGTYFDTNVEIGSKGLHVHLSEYVKPGMAVNLSPLADKVFRELL